MHEFRRLYGVDASRIDGHHHMLLSGNGVLGRLLTSGTIVRRTFSFQRGEKGVANLLYRRCVDAILPRSHYLVDHFFSLMPVEPSRLARIVALARHAVVEIETHPVAEHEYRFVIQRQPFGDDPGISIAGPSALTGNANHRPAKPLHHRGDQTPIAVATSRDATLR
jgi:hypothetical protein